MPEREHDLDQNQNDDDQFQRLALRRVNAIVEQLIEVRNNFELARDDAFPLLQINPLSRRPVQSRQLQITHQLQGVLDTLAQQR